MCHNLVRSYCANITGLFVCLGLRLWYFGNFGLCAAVIWLHRYMGTVRVRSRVLVCCIALESCHCMYVCFSWMINVIVGISLKDGYDLTDSPRFVRDRRLHHLGDNCALISFAVSCLWQGNDSNIFKWAPAGSPRLRWLRS